MRGRDLGHCLVPPSLEWILCPYEGGVKSPTLFLFPASPEYQPGSEGREAVLPSKNYLNEQYSWGTLI